ncbi:MAG TPA: FimV/HubP family polar landmark protein [Pseudomonas sp.]|nr:FimV/HubP family polar landmark protein [Pseudomonas sp.]
MGEISLHSALNQPLDADIELLQPSDLNADEIKVRLASAEDFNRSGVDRFIFLNDLRFTPILRGGRYVVRVASSKPVREPYLNFIVELARPGGNLLREYTLLIDPPGSAAFNQVAAPAEPMLPEASRRDATPAVRQSSPPRVPPVALQGRHYQVQVGDNLWSIAGQVQDGRSREAVMADIHALNPAAFIAGDRNRLRAHVQLLMPDSAEPPVSAPVAAAPAPAPTIPAQQPVDAPQQTLPVDSPVDAELASEMTQNQELKQAIGDLQQQLQQLQQQMAEKDRQLEQIRGELEQRSQVVAAPPVEPVAAEVNAVPVVPAPVAESSISWSAGLGALCLALVGGLWLLIRRRAPARQPKPWRQASPTPNAARSSASVAAVAAPAPVPAVRVARPVVMEPVRTPVSTDALEGANIYIAYGRLNEAAAALRTASEREPQRLDLRLRLLEVLGELGDVAGFAGQERSLRELAVEPEQIEKIRARYAKLQAAPMEQVIPTASPREESVVVASELSDDFQLNLDDLSLDADWGLDSPFKPDAPVRSKAPTLEHDPAFRSNLRELPEVFELTLDKELLSPFGETELSTTQEDVLDEEFLNTLSSTSAGQERTSLESNLEHLAGDREHLARLNMALAYIEQGDIGTACDILNEVISSGDAEQQQRARELLAKIA